MYEEAQCKCCQTIWEKRLLINGLCVYCDEYIEKLKKRWGKWKSCKKLNDIKNWGIYAIK